MVNLFDFTKNEFSATFRSSCFSAKKFVERFVEITGNGQGTLATEVINTTSFSVEEVDLADSPNGKTTTPVRSTQKTTKRKAVTPVESPPVPSKVARPAKEDNNEAEDDISCDADFLGEINKHAVPGKLNY